MKSWILGNLSWIICFLEQWILVDNAARCFPYFTLPPPSPRLPFSRYYMFVDIIRIQCGDGSSIGCSQILNQCCYIEEGIKEELCSMVLTSKKEKGWRRKERVQKKILSMIFFFFDEKRLDKTSTCLRILLGSWVVVIHKAYTMCWKLKGLIKDQHNFQSFSFFNSKIKLFFFLLS